MAASFDPAERHALHFCMLGTLRLSVGGQPRALGSRARVLLATLVMADGVLTKEKAATSMWPESPTTQCLSNLRNLLYVLRKEHPELSGVLHVEGEHLRLGELEVDLWSLRRLLKTPDAPVETILSLYPGHLATELEGTTATVLRQTLASEFLVWASERISQLEVTRQYDDALRLAEHVLRVEPYHELTYRTLMRLHAELGDTALALRAYETCREALEEGVGEAPSADTRALARRIRERKKVGTCAPGSSPLPMVGRAVEWRQLTGAWKSCLGGCSAVHAVEGRAGIGKTRLLEELHQFLTRQGYRAVSVTCLELQAQTPFAVLLAVMEWLQGPAGPTSSRPTPSQESLQEALHTPPQLLQLQLQRRATSLIRRELPCCIILDDAQWCDAESLAWLEDATVSLVADPVLWIFGHLPLMHTSPLCRLFSSMARRGRFQPMELLGLSREESAQLAQQCGAADVDGLVEMSEGDPLAITQLVRQHWDPQQPLPLALTAAFERQLVQVGEARTLAAIMAVAERPLPLSFLDALDLPDIDARLEALLAVRLVEECADGTVRLIHGLLKKHVLAQVGRLTVRRLNGLIGKAWMRLPAPEALPEQIAMHLEAGGLETEAARYFLLAAEALSLQGRFQGACALAERSEVLATRTGQGPLAWQAGFLLARAALAACDEGTLLRALSRLEALAASTTDRDAQRCIDLLWAELWFLQGKLVRTADAYLRLSQEARPGQDPVHLLDLVSRMLHFFFRMRAFLPDRSTEQADQQLEQALSAVRRVFPAELSPKLLALLAQQLQAVDMETRNPQLMELLWKTAGGREPIPLYTPPGGLFRGSPSGPPESQEDALEPFEHTRQLLRRLSVLPSTKDRIWALDREVRSAFRRRQFSRVLFLGIAGRQLLEQTPWHGVRAFALELEVASSVAICHPWRALALADAATTRGFSPDSAVPEAFVEINRCWVLLALEDASAFRSALDRLLFLEARVGAHHPDVTGQVEKLKHEATILEGDISAALDASDRYFRWLQDNEHPGLAAWQGIQGHVLRVRAGLPSVRGEQLEAWADEALRLRNLPSGNISWLFGMMGRVYAEEGHVERAEYCRHRASQTFAETFQQLAFTHRPFYAAVQSAILAGRFPRREEYLRAYDTTLTEEEQQVADHAAQWLSGG